MKSWSYSNRFFIRQPESRQIVSSAPSAQPKLAIAWRSVAEITSQVRIDAVPEAVFDFIDRWQNAMRYMRRMVRYDIVDPDGGTGVGAEFLIAVQAGPTRLDGHIRVTEHERPRSIAFKTVEGVRVDGSWTLRPDGGGTHVTLHSLYEPPGGLIGRMVASFISRNAQNDLDASLRELKRLVEASAAQ